MPDIVREYARYMSDTNQAFFRREMSIRTPECISEKGQMLDTEVYNSSSQSLCRCLSWNVSCQFTYQPQWEINISVKEKTYLLGEMTWCQLVGTTWSRSTEAGCMLPSGTLWHDDRSFRAMLFGSAERDHQPYGVPIRCDADQRQAAGGVRFGKLIFAVIIRSFSHGAKWCLPDIFESHQHIYVCMYSYIYI